MPGTAAAVLTGGAGIGAVLAVCCGMDRLHPLAAVAGFMLYGIAGAIVAARVGRFHDAPRFGLANILTLTRLVITGIVAAFTAEAGLSALSEQTLWILFSLTAASLVMDGVDGFAARRLGLASRFGARFDMETDALLILVLSVMTFLLGKAGAWVLASGLLRYGYVAAAQFIPALTRPLAPAVRRKSVAAIQGAALTLMLSPAIHPPLSTAIAATALMLLVYSFSADIWTQVRGS